MSASISDWPRATAWVMNEASQGRTGSSLHKREGTLLESAVDHRPLRIGAVPPGRHPRRPRRELYAEGGIEPSLEDLLHDPLTEALMRRDGVSIASLRELISSTRRGLRERVGE